MKDEVSEIHGPYYLVEERLLRRNLQLISDVARRADVEIILAFKAFALWKTFPLLRRYISATTASSLFEARLAVDKFGAKAHTFSPAYTDDEADQIAALSSHLTFNSLSQYERLHERVRRHGCSIGLRVNPEYSEVGTMLYNPCAPGTRFGITADLLPERLPADVEGFHCHCHCESGSDVLQRTLQHIEQRFGRWLPQLRWLNLGGGHLMTRSDYDIELLVQLMQQLHRRYPQLHIILEPGSAFAWQTGPLVAHVVDIVCNSGITTAILDVSFTCHMPDCLEMPYMPEVRGAETMQATTAQTDRADRCGQWVYRLGGNSCLSGDFMGLWRFPQKLKIGDEVVFEDMIHYTTVKTTMFNGISHPSIVMEHEDGSRELLRRFSYEDYRDRMD
ncbi:MAG: carboxynorspermidine decarboxylase [Prevotella sp.]|nr:carboxynorspermidine decarboxylase [Prevotella sp.]